jgi:SAM-dependent methyltransferase
MVTNKGDWQERYFDFFYRKRKNWISGTRQFHELIQKHLSKDKHVLELGPGPKNNTSAFLSGSFASLHGLDVCEEARDNPYLHKIFIYDGSNWPIADDSYDSVVADFVLEHLEKPRNTIAEAFRVLRPGGLFFFRTPNLWHYVSMVSWLSPNSFHNLVANRLRQMPADAHDPWPTYYRSNGRRIIRNLMRDGGFNEVELVMIEKEPSYGMYSRILFLLFMVYERVVNSSDVLSMFRANLLGAFEKPRLPLT